MPRKVSLFLAVLALVFLGIRFYEQAGIRLGKPGQLTPTASAASATPRPAATVAVQISPIRVELSEQEVNRLLQNGLAQSGYQIDDLTVRLEEGQFVASTTQQVGFLRVPVTLVGQVSVADGRVAIRPLSVTASGVTLPQTMVDQLVNAFRDQLASSIQTLPIKISSIDIHVGSIVVQGSPK